eukprot:9236335-Pyramimonas_sp.AAC.1
MNDFAKRNHESAYRRDGKGMSSHRHPLPLPGSVEWPSAGTAKGLRVATAAPKITPAAPLRIEGTTW